MNALHWWMVKELHDLCLCLLASPSWPSNTPHCISSTILERLLSLPPPSPSLPKSWHTWLSLCSFFFKQRFFEPFKHWFFPSSKSISSTWIAVSLADSLSSLSSQLRCHFLKHPFFRCPKRYTSPRYSLSFTHFFFYSITNEGKSHKSLVWFSWYKPCKVSGTY